MPVSGFLLPRLGRSLWAVAFHQPPSAFAAQIEVHSQLQVFNLPTCKYRPQCVAPCSILHGVPRCSPERLCSTPEKGWKSCDNHWKSRLRLLSSYSKPLNRITV